MILVLWNGSIIIQRFTLLHDHVRGVKEVNLNLTLTGGEIEMLKQILLSSVAGFFVTTAFLVTPSANAACQGYCADKYLKDGCELGYAGCTIDYDANDKPYNVTCFYTGSCGGDLEMQ